MPNNNKTPPTESLYHPTKPMVQIELAARNVIRQFSTEWPKIEADFKGCFLQVHNTPDGKTTRWVVKGMTKDKAELYNERYAKSFARALIGILNIPNVVIEFEIK